MRHLRTILFLPGMVTLAIPALILWRADVDVELVPALFSALPIAAGLGLVVWTVRLFVTVGRGRPWSP